MIPLILEEILLQVEKFYKTPPPKWTESTVTDNDLKRMEASVIGGEQFDRLGLKKEVWNRYKKGTNAIQARECEFGRVVAILPKGLKIPDDWARVFQLFGVPKYGRKWNVYWFGSITPRRFPKTGLPLAAEHLNGGYTQVCSTDGIYIYRLEEATRVLIHELLHAACQDPVDTIPRREALIETWAEVIFVGLKAKGSPTKADKFWKLQCQWVADTNHKAEKDNKVVSENDYGWRYLNGRTEFYKKLGLEIPRPLKDPERSRFTHPELGD